MEKNNYIILIILGILIVVGYAYLNNPFEPETVEIGDLKFTLPSGYHEQKTNQTGEVIIANGENKITLVKYDDKNASSHITKYEKYLKTKNQTMKLDKTKVDNTTVYKSTMKQNPKVIHYWFVKNNKTYSIYTSNANDNTESDINYLIKSAANK